MSLREEMWKYEQITGESAEHVPIIMLGAFLDGYERAIKDAIKEFQPYRKYSSNRTNSEWVDRIEDVLKMLPSVTQQTNKEDEKMELRNEEKGYLENDKESVLETAQNIIADESFQYGGDSLTVLEIINAIKDGYRLANLAEVDRRICDAFDKGFEEGLRASKRTDDKPICDAFDKGFEEGLKASKKNDKPIFS